MRKKLTPYERQVRYTLPFGMGALPDYNFPKIKFCVRGHALVGSNFYIEKTQVRCRACRGLVKRRPNGNLREDVIRAVLLGLEEGKTMSGLTGLKNKKYVGGKVVDHTRLRLFCAANPALGKRIKALGEKNRIAAFRRRARVMAAPALLRNNGTDAFDAIQRATSHLWDGERADVMSLMFVAVAEGRLKIADACARLGEFVKAHRYRPRVFGDSSLDKPLWIDSNATLLDTLASGSSGLWD
jgi:hypothetical protein